MIILILLIALVVEIALLIFMVTYKPTMRIDSWGDPEDVGEACGLACILLVLILFVLGALVITIMAIVKVLK